MQSQYMYVLVRKDQSYGQIIVQAAHAAMEATRKLVSPEAEHPHLVICGIKNEVQLEKAKQRLDSIGIDSIMFYEADRNDEPTAFATRLVYGDERKHFRKYQLLKNNLGV